ncbi:MAG: hypothetical protein Q7Q71_16540 [Verrucomicrobiota bacterium JB023]|nr:hypothetical protein [Verrucomicrobiota bacterium JB023]
MNELKEKLQDVLNLDDEMADKAVEIVTDFLKSKLPENLHGLIDNFESGGAEAAGKAMDMVKGFMGGK